MASNRGVAYMGPGVVEIHSIDFPKLALGNRKCEHGVILKIVSTNICGSDQHMVRGRTTAPKGLVLGHEITGEVMEAGRDVEFIKVGDLVSVPFNIARRGLWLRGHGWVGRGSGRLCHGSLRRLQLAEIS
jgi:glutathione-independent formaldehyde dehydrogenase